MVVRLKVRGKGHFFWGEEGQWAACEILLPAPGIEIWTPTVKAPVLTTGLPVDPQSLLFKEGIGQELSIFKMYSEFRETWV